MAAFGERAPAMRTGGSAACTTTIADRCADLALARSPSPGRILDVGCGTGYLLRRLAQRCPAATELAGIDAAPEMIEAAAGQR